MRVKSEAGKHPLEAMLLTCWGGGKGGGGLMDTDWWPCVPRYPRNWLGPFWFVVRLPKGLSRQRHKHRSFVNVMDAHVPHAGAETSKQVSQLGGVTSIPGFPGRALLGLLCCDKQTCLWSPLAQTRSSPPAATSAASTTQSAASRGRATAGRRAGTGSSRASHATTAQTRWTVRTWLASSGPCRWVS